MKNISLSITSTVIIFLSSTKIPHHFTARTFSNGIEILRCGHALLAAAYALKDIFFDTEYKFITPTGLLKVKEIDNQTWLGANPVKVSTSPPPRWTNKCFSIRPGHCALVGGENGYCILQWPTRSDISNLIIDFTKIALHTKRAIIATASGTRQTADYCLRYFAPQYGNNEDTATGSAHFVLAPFWQKKTGQHTFTAEQLSHGGGLMYSRIEDKKIWISGNVSILQTTPPDFGKIHD